MICTIICPLSAVSFPVTILWLVIDSNVVIVLFLSTVMMYCLMLFVLYVLEMLFVLHKVCMEDNESVSIGMSLLRGKGGFCLVVKVLLV